MIPEMTDQRFLLTLAAGLGTRTFSRPILHLRMPLEASFQHFKVIHPLPRSGPAVCTLFLRDLRPSTMGSHLNLRTFQGAED